MSDEKSSYKETSKSTTETKTTATGAPVKDAGGDNVKETTTTTKGESKSEGDSKKD